MVHRSETEKTRALGDLGAMEPTRLGNTVGEGQELGFEAPQGLEREREALI